MKTGKTSLATQFPKSLLLGFERGYNALPGIMALDVPTWTVMKEVLRELKKQEVKNQYDSIIVDTASIAWDRCSEYICNQNGVQDLIDIPWGKGQKLCAKEYEKVFREITLLGYGLVFLAHAEEKIPFGGDESQSYIAPMLDKRPYRIINAMVDIIACIDVNKDTGERFLQMRSTPRIVAGCRFKYMPDTIPLNYQVLVDSLGEAIEKQGEEAGGLIVDERIDIEDTSPKKDFKEVMKEAEILWNKILDVDDSDETLDLMERCIENNFGSKIKLSSATSRQQELLELTILDLEDLYKKITQ